MSKTHARHDSKTGFFAPNAEEQLKQRERLAGASNTTSNQFGSRAQRLYNANNPGKINLSSNTHK